MYYFDQFHVFFIHQVLQTEVQRLKDEVQEKHRDLTKHHSLINTDTMDEILDRSLLIDKQIVSQYSAVQTQRAIFEEVRLNYDSRKDIILSKHSSSLAYSGCVSRYGM